MSRIRPEAVVAWFTGIATRIAVTLPVDKTVSSLAVQAAEKVSISAEVFDQGHCAKAYRTAIIQ